MRKTKFLPLGIGLAVLLAFGFLFGATQTATADAPIILTVGATCTYDTVQEAVNDADNFSKTYEIHVAAERFTGASARVLVDNKPTLHIIGGYDASCAVPLDDVTILKGFDATTPLLEDSIIEVRDNSEVIFERFDILGYEGSETPDVRHGLKVIDSILTLRDSEVFDLKANFGAGVWVDGGEFHLEAGSLIYRNQAIESGAGIYAINNSDLFIEGQDVEIRENVATLDGAGIYLASGSELWFDAGQIHNNIAERDGGAIYATGLDTRAELFNSSLFCTDALSKCTQLRANHAEQFGGAVYLADRAEMLVDGAYIESNIASKLTNARGSAFYLQTNASLEMLNSIVVDNAFLGTNAKGLIHLENAQADIYFSTFADNIGQVDYLFSNQDSQLDVRGIVTWNNAGTALVETTGTATSEFTSSLLQWGVPASATGINNLVDVDPLFLDTEFYRLDENSRAVNMVPRTELTNPSLFELDIERETRSALYFDAGAHEIEPRVRLNADVDYRFSTIREAIDFAEDSDIIRIKALGLDGTQAIYQESHLGEQIGLGQISKDLTFTVDQVLPTDRIIIDGVYATESLVKITPEKLVRFEYMELKNAQAERGAILFADLSSEVVLQDVILKQGAAIEMGGGIYANSALIELHGESYIVDNSAVEGAGIYMNGGRLEMFDSSAIYANEAIRSGGGIYAKNGADVIMHNNTLIGAALSPDANFALNGAGLYLKGVETQLTMLDDSAILRNQAIRSGAGIYVDSSRVEMFNSSKISANKAVLFGGAIFAKDGTYIEMRNEALLGDDILEQSNLALDGAGLYVRDAETQLVMWDNSAIQRNKASRNGGGIYLGANVLQFDLSDAQILENLAKKGAGIFVAPNVADRFQLELVDSLVRGNVADFGAGIYNAHAFIPQVDYLFDILVQDTRFELNQVQFDGGAIYNELGQLWLNAEAKEMVFESNKAYRDGGAIFDASANRLSLSAQDGYALRFGNLDMTNPNNPISLDLGNEARDGGAIYLKDAQYLEMRGQIQLWDNHATNRGGALYIENLSDGYIFGQLETSPIQMLSNTAFEGGAIYLKDVRDLNQALFTGVEMRANIAVGIDAKGGALFADNSRVSMSNIWVLDNEADRMGGAFYIQDSKLDDGFTSDIRIQTNLNQVTTCTPSALGVERACVEFSGNALRDRGVERFGSAIYMRDASKLYIRSAMFESNVLDTPEVRTPLFGAAIYSLSNYDRVELVNVLVSEHQLFEAEIPTALLPSLVHFAGNAIVKMDNNTFVNNQVEDVLRLDSPTWTLESFRYNILWNSEDVVLPASMSFAGPDGIFGTADDMDMLRDESALVAYNIVQDLRVVEAIEDVTRIWSENPIFVASPISQYSLHAESPALDRGLPAIELLLPSLESDIINPTILEVSYQDMSGQQRSGLVDLGAVEFFVSE